MNSCSSAGLWCFQQKNIALIYLVNTQINNEMYFHKKKKKTVPFSILKDVQQGKILYSQLYVHKFPQEQKQSVNV